MNKQAPGIATGGPRVGVVVGGGRQGRAGAQRGGEGGGRAGGGGQGSGGGREGARQGKALAKQVGVEGQPNQDTCTRGHGRMIPPIGKRFWPYSSLPRTSSGSTPSARSIARRSINAVRRVCCFSESSRLGCWRYTCRENNEYTFLPVIRRHLSPMFSCRNL